MRKFLQNKKGVTLLEGLIALLLLAMIATGAFAVLLSTSRQSGKPDLEEEMAVAIERAGHELQMRYNTEELGGQEILPDELKGGLCKNDHYESNPFDTAEVHPINCKLPPICDRAGNRSFFYYEVEIDDNEFVTHLQGVDKAVSLGSAPKITFHITCNGFTL